MIITDQWNQTAHLYEIQVTVIYSRDILVAKTPKCRVKRVIYKTWTGKTVNSVDTDQTPQKAASDQSLHCLHKFQEVKGKWMSLKCPFSTISLAYTLRQSTSQCCQCFDCPTIALDVSCLTLWTSLQGCGSKFLCFSLVYNMCAVHRGLVTFSHWCHW